MVPRTERMTSMLGRETAGPERRRASAGPFPIPAPSNPCKMGTSVKVAKYIKAPEIAAKKLARSPFPPTSSATNREGMKASCPGRPRKNPAPSTPRKSKGRICRASQ